jgi:hypothetical protein
LGKRRDDLELKLKNIYKEYKQLEEQYTLLNNKLNLILNFLDESKVKQTIYNQNSEYIKKDVMRLTQRIDFLKGKLNTESVDKKIVLPSSRLVKPVEQ